MSAVLNKRVLVAGATGAIGQRLCPLLVADGWQVTGTTRFAHKVKALRAMGVTPLVVDVFDELELQAAVAEAQPRIVIHQLTDLPARLDPAKMADGLVRNARIRDIGTRHLIAASVAAGVERMIVQSIAFVYEDGPMPYCEESPLGTAALAAFEQQVLNAPMVGIVLRYGRFYGPGTGFDVPSSAGCPVHVDAAADAARRAVTRGTAGIYNVAEDDGVVSSQKAISELGWDARFRCPVVEQSHYE